MSLKKHATSLTFMHAADVLQPLIILPFAARMLEPVRFGEFALALSISQIAATLVGYGFHWTGQREAASIRNEPMTVARLFAEIMSTQAALFVIVALVGLSISKPLFGISTPLFLCALLTPAGNLLFPAWLLIALERAWQVALAVIAARILALCAFLILVTSPGKILIAVAIQTSIPLVSAAIAFPFVLAVGFRGFRYVTAAKVIGQFREGWRGFLFTLIETAIVALPVPIVAQLSGYVAAGQYSVAGKFVSATRPFFRIVSETFLPRVAYYARHNPAGGVALIRNSLFSVVGGAAISLALYFAAPPIILTFFGSQFAGAIPIVRILAVVPILANINVSTSNLYMFAFGHERAWAYLSVCGLLAFLATSYGLTYFTGAASISVALAVIARETLVLSVSTVFFVRFGFLRNRTPDMPAGVRTATQRGSEAPPANRVAPSQPTTTN